jgi:tetratricopeptide (TPR) repeat protein
MQGCGPVACVRPAAYNAPVTSEPDSGCISARALQAVLARLAQDPPLLRALGDEPLDHLQLTLEDGAVSLRLRPSANVADADRSLVQSVVNRTLEGALRDRPLPPADSRPHVIAARSHLDQGNPGRAVEVAEEALQRWPDNLDLRTYRALGLSALGRIEESIREYREVLRRDPRSAFANSALSGLLVRQGDWQGAVAHARAALALAPDDALALHALALANEKLELYQEAQEALHRALEVDPDLPGAAEDLRRVEEQLAPDVEIDLLGPQTPTASTAPTAAPPPPPSPASDARWGAASHELIAPTNGRRCPQCQTANPDRVSFCVKCGARLG